MDQRKWGNKRLFIIPIILFLYSCHNKNIEVTSFDFYYFSSSGASINREHDTSLIKKFKFHAKGDSLFIKYEFVLDGKKHELRRYSNMHNSRIDATHFSFELDDFGVIYSSSFTFQNQTRLICSNDSINRIITYALGEALFNSELAYTGLYESNRPVKTISFIEK